MTKPCDWCAGHGFDLDDRDWTPYPCKTCGGTGTAPERPATCPPEWWAELAARVLSGALKALAVFWFGLAVLSALCR